MIPELHALEQQLWHLGNAYLKAHGLDTPPALTDELDHVNEALHHLGHSFTVFIPDHPTDDMPDMFYEPFTWRDIAQLAVHLAVQAAAELSIEEAT